MPEKSQLSFNQSTNCTLKTPHVEFAEVEEVSDGTPQNCLFSGFSCTKSRDLHSSAASESADYETPARNQNGILSSNSTATSSNSTEWNMTPSTSASPQQSTSSHEQEISVFSFSSTSDHSPSYKISETPSSSQGQATSWKRFLSPFDSCKVLDAVDVVAPVERGTPMHLRTDEIPCYACDVERMSQNFGGALTPSALGVEHVCLEKCKSRSARKTTKMSYPGSSRNEIMRCPMT